VCVYCLICSSQSYFPQSSLNSKKSHSNINCFSKHCWKGVSFHWAKRPERGTDVPAPSRAELYREQEKASTSLVIFHWQTVDFETFQSAMSNFRKVCFRFRDGLLGTVTRLHAERPRNRGFIHDRSKTFFSFPKLYRPHGFLLNGYQTHFSPSYLKESKVCEKRL
jgi:hypothetical protein